MGEPKTTPVTSDTPAVEVTKAQAAKAVVRQVLATDKAGKPLRGDDGKLTGEMKDVPVKAEEVFDYAVRGEQVIVVTVDGQKLAGKL